MTLLKDLGWVAATLLLMPLIMAVAFVAVAVILLRSLYRWARGNTTSTSRVGAPVLVPSSATSHADRS